MAMFNQYTNKYVKFVNKRISLAVIDHCIYKNSLFTLSHLLCFTQTLFNVDTDYKP